MSPPAGIWGAIVRGLASPWAAWAAGCLVGILGILGVGAGFGQHPAEGPLAQVAVVIIVFSALAALLRRGEIDAVVWAAGLSCVALGAALAGGEAGELRLRAGEIETYEQVLNGRGATTHLGGRLALSDDGASLRLLVKDRVLGEGPLPAPGGEVVVGPWRMHRRGISAGAEPTHAVIAVAPRGSDAARTLRMRPGQSVAVDDSTQVTLRRLVGDYGKALGAAALVDVTRGDVTTTTWHFVEAPDLDARVGSGPVVVRLEGVEVADAIVLGVRRAGVSSAPIAIGFGIMACGMLLGVARRRA